MAQNNHHHHHHHRKTVVSPELALASDLFDKFCGAGTFKTILSNYRSLCEILHIKSTNYPQFYPKLKSKLCSWRAQALWNKFDKRANHKCYNRGKACPNTRVLIIGAGPCGLRAAIEAQLLGAKVVVVEKRDRVTRNNVLHLWPFVIQDLRTLGAKKFFGKFCAGSIDHISIRQVQCILLKVALLLGVEIHEGVSFDSLVPPSSNEDDERTGWRAKVTPEDHPVSQYEFDVLMGADGKRNTLEGFKRKEFRGKLAIAITANFINHHSEAEARVEEISGVAYIFNQKFFKDLKQATGIDLENIVYYKDDTHYFVMTAKKTSLLNKGVILNDYADTAKLLALENINKEALKDYAKEAADFSTGYKLPQLQFAVNHYGQPDVAMFDFTSMYAAENASRVVQVKGYKLLMCLVGDSLLEPFWPTGSGCARGFLSSMDACWAVRSWASCLSNPLEVVAERESIYRLLNQTTPENLSRDFANYTLDPHTRYPNLNARSVLPIQVKSLYNCDDPSAVEICLKPSSTLFSEYSKKRRRKDTQIHHDVLLSWLKRQIVLYDNIHIEDTNKSFKNGLVLCAIIHRYRPDLIDFHTIDPSNVRENNQLAFDILENEFGILPVMTGIEMEKCEVPDHLTMLSYLAQVYDTFRGEIPYTHQRTKMDDDDLPIESNLILNPNNSYKNVITKLSPMQKLSLLSRLSNSLPRKRYRESRSPTVTNRGIIDVQVPRKSKKRKSASSAAIIEGRKNRFENVKKKSLDNLENTRHDKEDHKFVAARILKSVNLWQRSSKQEKPDNENENIQFEDYSMFLYRQSAPDFKERVKELEKKLLHTDRDVKGLPGIKRNPLEGNFSGRIKDIETKLKEGNKLEKKPKDLLRAIGKIEKTDWNIKEIEKKIEENKYGRVHQSTAAKVPKWNRQQFDDKFTAVKNKLIDKESQQSDTKYAQIDTSLKRLEQKLRNGTALEQGQRGANKVSAMAAQLTTLKQQPEEKLSKSGSRVVICNQSGSEMCHFCNKRVYLMERLNAEGRFFHRGCFRCEYCDISLRLGNYSFDKEGKYGSRFYCVHHFGYPGVHRTKLKNRQQNVHADEAKGMNISRTPTMVQVHKYSNDSIDTPERVEFENLEVDREDTGNISRNEMDEDEWTDHNFGTSANELASSDDVSDISDSDEEDNEDEYAQALDIPALDNNESLEYTRRFPPISLPSPKSEPALRKGSILNDENRKSDVRDDSESSCSEESVGNISYHEFESEDDDSNTATAEEEIKARELRMKEVRLEVPDRHNASESGSETEVASDDDDDEYSAASSSEDEDDDDDSEEDDSATEISTDSEFERNNGTVSKSEIPNIIISESVSCRRVGGNLDRVKAIQVVGKNIAEKNIPVMRENVKTTKPPCSIGKCRNEMVATTTTKTNTRIPLVNPHRGDYYLNRTQSTEGVASKISLELKKKYLLGDSASNLVKKSESTSVLDTKFKSFVDQISEHQKLLNLAPEPSVSMQASSFFLDDRTVTKLRNSSISPTSSSLTNCKTSKELVGIEDFRHICNQSIDSDEKTTTTTTTKTNERKTDKPDESCVVDDEPTTNVNISSRAAAEGRTPSPIYETSIVVPDFPPKKKEIAVGERIAAEIDSSDNSSAAEAEEDEDCEDENENSYHSNANAQISLPKVEIHNSQGELLPHDVEETSSDINSINVVNNNPSNNNSNNDNDNNNNNNNNDDNNYYTNNYNNRNENFKNNYCKITSNARTVCQIPLNVVSPSAYPASEEKKPPSQLRECVRNESARESTSTLSKIMAMPNAQILKHVSTPAELFVSSLNDSKRIETAAAAATSAAKNSLSDKSSPSTTPTSVPGDDNTLAVFTETELSDWARDEDCAVSEGFDDMMVLGTPNITYRRHQKPKKQRANRGAGCKSSKGANDMKDEFVHVCGRTAAEEKFKPPPSFMLADIDSMDIEFMDTGEDEDDEDTGGGGEHRTGTANPLFTRNSGYIEYVTSDDEAKTPLAEAINSSYPSFSYCTSTSTVHSAPAPLNNVNAIVVEADRIVSPANGKTEDDDGCGGYHLDENLNKSNPTSVAQRVDDHDDVISNPDDYDRFVRRFQDRISPFGNVKDSIDVRKLQKTPKSPIKQMSSTSNDSDTFAENAAPPPPKIYGPSQKLEELSRERSKQKNLIHEMVMSKLQSECKTIQDRKAKRNSRISLSPFNSCSARNSLPNVDDDDDDTKRAAAVQRNNAVTAAVVVDSSQNKENIDRDDDYEKHCPPFSSLAKPGGGQYVRSIDDDWNDPSSTRMSAAEKYAAAESFSLPDIRKALNDVGDKLLSPALPSTTRLEILKSTESIRQQARTRARLMSDSELGLSPEDKLKLLKQKIAARKAVKSAYYHPKAVDDYANDDGKNTYTDDVLDALHNTMAEIDSKADNNDEQLSPRSKAIKEKDRKKSIIQAVSDFFSKKSPTKTAISKDSPSPTKLRFKISLMGKEKCKNKNTLVPENTVSRTKYASDYDLRKRIDNSVPPRPPSPLSYAPSTAAEKSDENLSITSVEGKESSTLSTSRQLRLSHRKTKRENQKRLRMAQEIQRQLEEIEVKQKELEFKGVNVEKALRNKNQNSETEFELMQELLDMIRERNELRKFEEKLLSKAKEIEAEDPY